MKNKLDVSKIKKSVFENTMKIKQETDGYNNFKKEKKRKKKNENSSKFNNLIKHEQLNPFELFRKEMSEKLKLEGVKSEEEIRYELTKRYLKLSSEDLKKYLTKIPRKKTEKRETLYVVESKDKDFHYDNRGTTYEEIKGIFKSKEKANNCVQNHFAFWDKKDYTERLKFRHPKTGLIHIKAVGPEEEIMDCWAEVVNRNNRKKCEKEIENLQKNGEKEISENEHWTDNCSDDDLLILEHEYY